MKKISLVSLLVLLIATHSVADNILYENIFMPGEFEELSVVGNEIEQLFESPSWLSKHKGKTLVNVDSFGAVGDGVSDDTQAFVSAWNKACSTRGSVFLVPKGRHYLVKPAKFEGPCVDKLIIQINGTIVAPDEPNDWDPNSPNLWLEFSKLKRVTFQGVGVIDGSGNKWWASSCKKNKENPCRGAPTAVTIDSSSMVEVKDLTIKNGQQMHFVISRSDTVRIFEIQISAPNDSPNTDGIHITGSTDVVVQNCKIGTGDDCISIVNASSTIKMKNIYCGPGHGISIGSLGKDNSTGIVTKVVLDTAFLKETTNGLRIKTWQGLSAKKITNSPAGSLHNTGGSGYVRSVRFENVRMVEVANPIIIDQFYCDSPKSCQNQLGSGGSTAIKLNLLHMRRESKFNRIWDIPHQLSYLYEWAVANLLGTSAVKISQVVYRNITGTTTSANAIKFACSDTVPCSNIVLSNINLESKEGAAETYCNSAMGFGYGVIPDCLLSSNKESHSDQTKDSELVKFSSTDLVHTEL
ncbi:Glycoside hydrolase [Macleaya cordata]|uniref:Glycoside hydrolase n=1 Tax=Macleaya cordata TaxID=56857 RepID=A0A200RDD4_MACCD|nr:Glycoside hydrolase [Macleaya cordata]